MRMYCIFSRESIKKMGGNRGKLASMAGHAFLHAYWSAQDKLIALPPLYDAWTGPRVVREDSDEYKLRAGLYHYHYNGKAKKITLVVDTDAELEAIYEEYKDKLIGSTKVVDAGLTVFTEPTLVCIGLGPCEQLEIPGSKVLI